MYLTKITINETQFIQNRLFDTYAIHQFVYKLMAKEKRDFTFNSEIVDNKLIIMIYHKNLVEITDFESETVQLTENFFNKNYYEFNININSVVRKIKNYYSVKRDKMNEWLTEKFQKNGIKLIQLTNAQPCQLKFKKKEHDVVLYSNICNGIIEIENKEKFQLAIEKGIGRGRAFGLGMLLVKPVIQ